MQSPYNQEVLFKQQQAIHIDRKSKWGIVYRHLATLNFKFTCYSCQKKNSVGARAQFMRCGHCNQINKVADPDPLFYIDFFCQHCSKRIKIPKNATIFRCPFCLQMNRKLIR